MAEPPMYSQDDFYRDFMSAEQAGDDITWCETVDINSVSNMLRAAKVAGWDPVLSTPTDFRTQNNGRINHSTRVWFRRKPPSGKPPARPPRPTQGSVR